MQIPCRDTKSQAVIGRTPATEEWFSPNKTTRGSAVDNMSVTHIFFRVLWFSPVSIFHQYFKSIHSCIKDLTGPWQFSINNAFTKQ